jgi:hypothetical protein
VALGPFLKAFEGYFSGRAVRVRSAEFGMRCPEWRFLKALKGYFLAGWQCQLPTGAGDFRIQSWEGNVDRISRIQGIIRMGSESNELQ